MRVTSTLSGEMLDGDVEVDAIGKRNRVCGRTALRRRAGGRMRKWTMIGLGALSAGLFTTFATFGRRKWKQRQGRAQGVRASSGRDHEQDVRSSEVERRTSESTAAGA